MTKLFNSTAKLYNRLLKRELIDKLYSIISPAQSVDDILLDYNGTLTFKDLYDYNGQVIGTGGFGVVLRAIDKMTHEEVAIKILNIEDYVKSSSENAETRYFKVEKGLKFLRNEVTISQGYCHKNIMKVKRVHRTQQHVLIAMELAKCSLAEYIEARGGKLPEEECRVIIKQLLEALQHLHIADIVHKDIKPSNILLMSDENLEGAVRLIDFGISTKLTDALPYELANTVGTFLYKAPEQFKGGICTTVRISNNI
jgi:serine/threonine protein kinase